MAAALRRPTKPLTREQKKNPFVAAHRHRQAERIRDIRRAIRTIAEQKPEDLYYSRHFSVKSPHFSKEMYNAKKHIYGSGLSHKQKVLLHHSLDRAIAKAKGFV